LHALGEDARRAASPEEFSYMDLLQHFGHVSLRPIRPLNYPTAVLK